MGEAPALGESVENPSTRLVVAQDGDTLSHIVLQEFGRVDVHLLDVVQELNPEIDDINQIIAGQEIRLPLDPLEAYRNPGMPSYFSSHVASFKKFDEAERFFNRIIQSGGKAALCRAELCGKGLWYRVTIGEYRDAAEASHEAAKLVESGRFLYAKPLKLPELRVTRSGAADSVAQ
jgi:phage tail protein X